MCLIPKQNCFQRLFKVKPKIKIAKKDIKVYKLLIGWVHEEYFSYFYTNYMWKLNEPRINPLILEHQRYRSATRVRYAWVVNEGLHAVINIHKYRFIRNNPSTIRYHLYNAIIPKGSHYIIGNSGDIVSDQLIIIDKYKK